MTTSARWCPICQGAKSPSEDVCLACGITKKAPVIDHSKCHHGQLAHLETCDNCLWQRPSADDEYNEQLKRETGRAIRLHPNTR